MPVVRRAFSILKTISNFRRKILWHFSIDLITDHNVQETLTITDRAYLLFEGRILFQGKPEELAENRIVKEKYLGSTFVLRKKDFQLLDEQKRKRDQERELND